MKVRAKLSGPSQDTERCFELSKRLTETACGFAYADYLLKPERRKEAPVLYTYDVAGGLSTAAGHLRLLALRLRTSKSKERVLSLSEKVNRAWKNLKQKGDKIAPANVKRLQNQLADFQREFWEIRRKVENTCKPKGRKI